MSSNNTPKSFFDEAYYLQTYEDVRKSDIDPFAHFMKYGHKEGRDPNCEFSTNYYKEKYPEIDINPFLHYLKYGHKEGRYQNKHEEVVAIIKGSNLFDSCFYKNTYSDVSQEDPIDHYVRYGCNEGRDPNCEFSTNYYKEKYSEIDINPFLHYILFGKDEGRHQNKYEQDILLIQKSGLFDEEYYKSRYQDIREDNPLYHYVRYGCFEGRSPNSKFDTKFYSSLYNVAYRQQNALTHYINNKDSNEVFINELDFNRTKIEKSGLFDEEYYYHNALDVKQSGIDPIIHYLEYGALEGRNPNCIFDTKFYIEHNKIVPKSVNPLVHYIDSSEDVNIKFNENFDSSFYLNRYPDVESCNMSPLYHYIKYGKKEKRETYNRIISNLSVNAPLVEVDILISIVMPVFNAVDDVEKCINSIYLNKSCHFELIVLDDCSDQKTKTRLEELEEQFDFELIRNDRNLRFTKNVNKGLSRANGDLIVILNSDTVVTKNWLEKIYLCFKSDDNIGIAGPLSNAASWQSLPEMLNQSSGDWIVNELYDNYSVDDMALLVEVLSSKKYPEIPSANGFCFSFKRELLSKVGLLDEETFPTGYGEEDDYCIRAKKQGYKIALIDDLYIYHSKSKSYTHDLRQKFTKSNQGALEKKHGKKVKSELIKAWKSECFIEDFRACLRSYLQVSQGKKYVVYTAIFGPYDNLKDPEFIHSDTDYICFTDNQNLQSSVFDIKIVPKVHSNTTKNARMMKVLSHLFLIGYNYSLWIDGSTKIRGKDFKSLFDNMMDDIAVHAHIKRDCIYEEAKACLGLKKDSEELITSQIKFFHTQNYPFNAGLVETAQLIKRFTEKVKKHNVRWWDFINKGSIRDQLSFNYVTWEQNSSYQVLEDHQWSDKFFKNLKHNSTIDRIYSCGLLVVIPSLDSVEKSLDILSKVDCVNLDKFILHKSFDDKFIDCKSLQNIIDRKEYSYYIFMEDCFEVCENSNFSELISDLLTKKNMMMTLPLVIDSNFNQLNSPLVNNTFLKEKLFNKFPFVCTKYQDFNFNKNLVSLSYSLFKRSALEQYINQASVGAFTFDCEIISNKQTIKIGLLLSGNIDGQFYGSTYIRVILPLLKFYKDLEFVNIEVTKDVDQCDLVIINRIINSKELLDYALKTKKTIFDIDDYLLGDSIDLDTATKENLVLSLEKSNVVSVSSEVLKNYYSKYNSNILVQRNILEHNLFGEPKINPNEETINILYMGTYTHYEDFQVIDEALKQLKIRYLDKVVIDVIGVVPKNRQNFNHINFIAPDSGSKNYMEFIKWLSTYKRWHIGLAPLKDTKFNRAKSDIKFLDYSLLQLAGVYSDIGVYNEIVDSWKNGVLVENTTKSWFNAIDRLMKSKVLRNRIIEKAHNEVLTHRCTDTNENQWMKNIKSLMQL